MSEKQHEIWGKKINEKGTEMENKLYYVSPQNVSIVLWLFTQHVFDSNGKMK